MDEFEQIAGLYRPLTFGAPEALDLQDDAAVIPGRPGYDLVVTKDAMAAGVHFLPDDPLDLVARKLLRVNLSDLAAKAAEPYGYFLAVAWPASCGQSERTLFAAGLRDDQIAYGLRLFGGDTISTPGPLTLSVTLLGWARAGCMVRRSTARAGDVLLVSGTIGDGGLGLKAARDELTEASLPERAALVQRYRLPEPRLALRSGLRAHATAAADVSDGLLADALHIADASGLGVRVHLDRLPISSAAQAWCDRQLSDVEARLTLASLGDDYEVVCTAPRHAAAALITMAAAADVRLTSIGEMVEGRGLSVLFNGEPVTTGRTGWRHV